MTLFSIAEVAYRQVFQNPGDETPITLQEFIETAKGEYAFQMLLWYWNEKQREGEAVIPSHLLTEKEMEVKNDAIDISSLNIFRNLPNDLWLQKIGDFDCKCQYMKSDVNLTQLLCDDDSAGDDVRPFLVVGKKIKFPKGTHASKLMVLYANSGDEIDGDIEVEDSIGGIVRTRLVEIYLGKSNPEDTTNNTNPNN